MKAFNIDFNWQMHADGARAAAPGLFTDADPKTIVEWYEWLGADCFWNFAQSYNGYTWYDSKYALKNSGLKGDFLKETTELGKEKGMMVFSYMCMGANPYWESIHPETARIGNQGSMSTIPTEEYLELFTNVMVEAINHCSLDGLAIDWFRGPVDTRKEWAETEKELYKKLMGEKFPQQANPDRKTEQLYDKNMIEYMWNYVKSGLTQTRKIKIWANEPFLHNEETIWAGNEFLKNVDYTLNESYDLTLIDEIKSYSDNIKVIQNICGWKEHDISKMNFENYKIDGLFGFAQADEKTCLPEKPNENSNDVIKANYNNILLTKEMFSK